LRRHYQLNRNPYRDLGDGLYTSIYAQICGELRHVFSIDHILSRWLARMPEGKVR